ncbi:MAG: hypothetical protein ACREDE_07455 [Thermoplasmata archaeon]
MGCLVVFHLPEGSSRALHRRFARRVMGEETTSWGGKYRYRRKGLVDGTAHVLLHTGIVLLREEDTPGMCRRVRKEGGVVEVRRVELTRSDQRTLNRASG